MCFQIRFGLKQQTGQGKQRGPRKGAISLRSQAPCKMDREKKVHESSDLFYTNSERRQLPEKQSVAQLS